MKHVIIGSGAAGISAAKTIRARGNNDDVVIVSADSSAYSRCMLYKFISGERSVEELSFIPDRFFEQNRIRWRPDMTVSKVDTLFKRVKFVGGSESYDRLLIATGAESIIPPIEGLKNARNAFGLRHLSDARMIRDSAAQADNIIIIGAGLVGLNAAYGLIQMGKAPVVVEMAGTILSANLDTRAASVYYEKFEEAGCTFRLNSKVNGILSDANGVVTAVILDSGERMLCDLLVVATGVRPAISFLSDSGIAYRRDIAVDKYLATNADGVYAAGDATGLSENWPNAVLQGEIAALNMIGVPTEYHDNNTFSLKNTIHFFGIPSLTVGQFMPSDGDIENCREDRGRYQKVITRDGVPVGVILQGDIARSGFWHHLIKNQINISSISKSIWKVSFADSYSVEANGEYKWLLGV